MIHTRGHLPESLSASLESRPMLEMTKHRGYHQHTGYQGCPHNFMSNNWGHFCWCWNMIRIPWEAELSSKQFQLNSTTSIYLLRTDLVFRALFMESPTIPMLCTFVELHFTALLQGLFWSIYINCGIYPICICFFVRDSVIKDWEWGLICMWTWCLVCE